MRSLNLALLAVLAVGLMPYDAQAQISDRAALLPSEAEAVEAMAPETIRPVPTTRRRGETTLDTGRDGEIAIDTSGATRREILNRLFADREVEIEWRNKAFADEMLQGGRLSGPPIEIARRLLTRVNYVMSYEADSDEPRLARIVILGSDPPSVIRTAGEPPSRVRQNADEPSRTRQDPRVSEAARRRAAIDSARRAIAAAQRP
jgi:hypothetical protein